MPLFIIVVVVYAVYFYLIWHFQKTGVWIYIGAVIGVPILIVCVVCILQSMGLYMDLGDLNECAKRDWATGECRDRVGP
jgi:hypothetical protein